MNKESFFKTHKPSVVIYLLSFGGLLLSVGLIQVIGYDIFWHLATGRVIDLLHIIPKNDIFSYTAFGAPWINHEWLFELLQWNVFESLGIDGLIAIKFALAISISFILFFTISYLSGSKNMALWGVIPFLWSASSRVMDRPFFLGMCFLAAFLFILHKYVREGTRAIWALPIAQLIWINCHGGAFLGVQIMGAFALGETIQALIPSRFGGPAPIDRTRIRRLWLITAASLAACTINPWGLDIFPFYFDHLRMDTILAFTEEWLPVLHPILDGLIPPVIFLSVAALTLISFIVNASRARLSLLIVSCGTILLITKGHRFGPEMMIANVPIMMLNFSQRLNGHTIPNIGSWINTTVSFALSAMILLFGLPLTFKGDIWNLPVRGLPIESAATNLVRFLDYYNIHGHVLNDMGMGGYLIYSRWPGERVFIDGRTPVYGDALFREFVEGFMNKSAFEELVKKYDIDYIVVPGFRGWDMRKFHAFLWKHPNWHLVYATNDGFIYLRDVPKFKGLIKKLELKEHPVIKALEAEEKKAKEEKKTK